MRFFCDTEFTDFRPAQLLSIGVVSEDGVEFYAELLTPELERASNAFVRANVLPQFGRVPNARVASLTEMGNRLVAFLSRYPGILHIGYDYKKDIAFFEELLGLSEAGRRVLLRMKADDIAGCAGELGDLAAERSYSQDVLGRLKPHHALADARALRARWLARPEESSSASGPAARAFLQGVGADHRGRTLEHVLAQSDEWLEHHHDFIQWLFPLPEPSPFNPQAPAPTRQEFAAMARDVDVRAGVLQGLHRILAFYGLNYDGASVFKAPNWPERQAAWAPWETHHDRRISRVLRALSLLGQAPAARALFSGIQPLVCQYRGAASARALAFWHDAVDHP